MVKFNCFESGRVKYTQILSYYRNYQHFGGCSRVYVMSDHACPWKYGGHAFFSRQACGVGDILPKEEGASWTQATSHIRHNYFSIFKFLICMQVILYFIIIISVVCIILFY